MYLRGSLRALNPVAVPSQLFSRSLILETKDLRMFLPHQPP
jgi:hypothetical protein